MVAQTRKNYSLFSQWLAAPSKAPVNTGFFGLFRIILCNRRATKNKGSLFPLNCSDWLGAYIIENTVYTIDFRKNSVSHLIEQLI